MDDYPQIIKNKWYQTWWGVVLSSALIIMLVLAIGFAVIAGRFYFKIKSGQGASLQKQFYGDFNQSINTAQTNDKTKRKDIETNDDPFLGNPGAKIVVVEFVDFKCPNCKASATILKKLLDKHAFEVKWIVRDFPAESLHPGASQFSELAYCAHQQGKFWLMHDAIFASQASLPVDLDEQTIKNLSSSASTDFTKLNNCFKAQQGKMEVNQDYTTGVKLGVRGTPTFFINGEKVEGVVPAETWEQVIKELK